MLFTYLEFFLMFLLLLAFFILFLIPTKLQCKICNEDVIFFSSPLFLNKNMNRRLKNIFLLKHLLCCEKCEMAWKKKRFIKNILVFCFFLPFDLMFNLILYPLLIISFILAGLTYLLNYIKGCFIKLVTTFRYYGS